MAGMDIFLICDENEHARVCRVCLIRDVRMYDLQSYPLETNFEAIIGISVLKTMELPPYLCYECAALVKKYSLFRERCLTGQATLYSILQSSGKVTQKDLNQIDRQKCHLTSKLTTQCLKDNIYYAEEGMTLHKVKEECTNIDDFEITVDCIKEEDDFMGDVDLDVGHSSDEPLSVHKVVKEKKKKVKKKGRKKKESVEANIEIKDDIDISEEVLQLQGTMAASATIKTLRELYDEPSNNEVLQRLKVAASGFLPDGWEKWKVRQDVIIDADPALLNKLRFCLPAHVIARAFNPDSKSLMERPYRDMKFEMLQWPFCWGLILGPPSLAIQVRGSGLQCELVAESTKSIRYLLISRKEASKALRTDAGKSDSETEESAEVSLSKRSTSSRLAFLEQESQNTRDLLNEILYTLEDQRSCSDYKEGGESDKESSVDGEERSSQSWRAPSGLLPEHKESLFNFSPSTKVFEPSIPQPDPKIKAQGFACQRFGEDTWNRIRYVDAQKKLHAAPVFSALAVNPQLLHLSPTNDLNEYLEKTEGAYGTITHGLLLQFAAFTEVVNQLADVCPEATTAINSLLANKEGDFHVISDHLLQFVCGKRAEAIERRRKALSSLNDGIASAMAKIPPSEKFLFNERQLNDLQKAPSSSCDAFKVSRAPKREFVFDKQEKALPQKKTKPEKKKKETKHSFTKQESYKINHFRHEKFQRGERFQGSQNSRSQF